MKLDTPFIKLPIRFDAEQLRSESEQIDESCWQPHPGKYPGNFALPLISYKGENNDQFHGTMLETPHLQKCEYTRQVISSFGEVFGRSRLMRLGGRSEVPLHVDANYHWHRNVRIHIPIVTNENVIFYCGDQSVHMKAGECWVFDSWLRHRVVNDSDETRIHLVLDTAGSSRFWSMLEQLHTASKSNMPEPSSSNLDYRPGQPANIVVEKYNLTPALSPGEVDGLVADIINDTAANSENEKQAIRNFEKVLLMFCKDWRALFSVYGYEKQGFNHYIQLMKQTKATLDSMQVNLRIARNGESSRTVFYARVYSAGLSPMVRDSHYAALQPDQTDL